MVLVACGWRHTVTVSSSGDLYTYGWSKYGQLGHGDFEDHLVPHKLEALKDRFISQVLLIQHNTFHDVSYSQLAGTWKFDVQRIQVIFIVLGGWFMNR